MPFTIIGIFTAIIGSVVLTMMLHASNYLALIIGICCGAIFTSLGLYLDSRK